MAYGAPNTLELLESDPMVAPLGLDKQAIEALFAKRSQMLALAGWLT